MSAWDWPQWVVALWCGAMMFLMAIPPTKDRDMMNFIVWASLVWVLWMGGFWS